MRENYWTRMLRSEPLSRRRLLRGGAVGLAGVAAAALVGCGEDDDSPGTGSPGTGSPTNGAPTARPTGTMAPAGNRGGEIRHARTGFIAGLDSDYSSSGNFYHSLALDGLLAFDEDGLPGISDMSLATQMEVVDETTFVFTVRNVKFQDGTDFNAEAVKFNLERSMQTEPAGGVNVTLFTNLTNVEAVDGSTARFVLSAPDPALPASLSRAGGLVLSPAHYADKAPADVRWNPVGTGPWKFDSFGEDQFIRWVAWPDHWRRREDGGSVAMADVFQMDVIPDPTVLVASLQTEAAHIIESPFAQLELLDTSPNVTSTMFPGRSTLSGYVNHGLPPTDNLKVRRALSMAWDADAYNRLFFSDRMTPATSILPSHSWAYKDSGLPAYDPAEAKTLVDGSGVAEADRVVRVAIGDTQAFQFLQTAWAEIGIRAEYIAPQEATGRLYRNRGETGDIHLSISDFNFRIDPHAQLSLQLSESGFFNMGAAPVGEIEQLLVQGNSTYDVEERRDIYHRIQEIQSEQLYSFIPKLELAHIQHHLTKVTGLRYHADATPYLAEVGFA